MITPDEAKHLATKALRQIEQESPDTSAEAMVLIAWLIMMGVLNNIMDNISTEKCFGALESVHFMVDRMFDWYEARARLPKEDRPGL